jgi:hypothetical protein
MSQAFTRSYAVKKKIRLYRPWTHTIFHSMAEHLYLQIDANFISDIQITLTNKIH